MSIGGQWSARAAVAPTNRAEEDRSMTARSRPRRDIPDDCTRVLPIRQMLSGRVVPG